MNLRLDEPFEIRSGIDHLNRDPFYETDAKTLFKWYYAYTSTWAQFNNLLYVEVIPLLSGRLSGISSGALDVKNLVITIEPTSYRIPEKFKVHAQTAVDLFKRSGRLRFLPDKNEWENNTALRIISVEPSGRIVCQRARYFDQVATNLTLDWASGVFPDGWVTIRINAERPINGALWPLAKSTLANTLGVAVMLYTKDLSPIIRVRSGALASIQRQAFHCTASGVHEIEENQPSGDFNYSLLESGMVKEIQHEIGLDRHEYDLFPVAIARELPRGGKPQLFYTAIAKVSEERIRQAMQSADEAYEYITGGDEFGMNTPQNLAEPSSEIFTYEGWACLQLSELFIEANRDVFGHL